MLREVYVIVDGLNLYHYSRHQLGDTLIKSTLTSGFLSALQSFSLEARESEIEYFSSKDEYFLFTPLSGSRRILVCVFDKNTDRKFADSMLKEVWEIVVNSHIVLEKFSMTIDDQKNLILTNKIKEVAELLFDDQYLAASAAKIFDQENSISSMRLINLDIEEIIYENARPRPLLKDVQVTELKLLLAALDKLSERLSYEQFEFLTIQCPGAIFSTFRKMNILAVVFSSGIIPEDNIKQRTIQIFETRSVQEFFSRYEQNKETPFEMELNAAGEVISQTGDPLIPVIEIFISTVINAITRFVQSFIRKKFDQVRIYFPNARGIRVQITQVDEQYQVSFA